MRKRLLLLALAIAAPASRAATLVWDANTETNLAGYNVYSQAGTNSQTWDVGLSTNKDLSGLTFGETYSLWVTAYNTDGIESDPSATVSYTPVPGVPPVPQFSTNWVKRAGNNANFHVAWKPVPVIYAATNYLWTLQQGGKTIASGSTTNLAMDILTAWTSPTIFTLSTTNIVGRSESYVKSYAQPKSVSTPLINFSLLPPPQSPPPPMPK